MSPNRCEARNRCKKWRECDRCAAIRQAQIADIAEKLEQKYKELYLTTLKPSQNTQKAIEKLRSSFMRRCLAPAGIWTVETGEEYNGLHINLITPKPLPAKWRACETYTELLICTARDAAAYISKRSGAPSEKQYIGRTFGQWGQIGALLAEQKIAPAVAAAAFEIVTSSRKDTNQANKKQPNGDEKIKTTNGEVWEKKIDKRGDTYWENEKDKTAWQREKPKAVLTRDEYRQIAMAHLPTIMHMTGRAL